MSDNDLMAEACRLGKRIKAEADRRYYQDEMLVRRVRVVIDVDVEWRPDDPGYAASVLQADLNIVPSVRMLNMQPVDVLPPLWGAVRKITDPVPPAGVEIDPDPIRAHRVELEQLRRALAGPCMGSGDVTDGRRYSHTADRQSDDPARLTVTVTASNMDRRRLQNFILFQLVGWETADGPEPVTVDFDSAENMIQRLKRVEKLCDEYRANCDPTSMQAQVAEIFRRALEVA